MEPTAKPLIFIAEDEPDILRLLKLAMQSGGWQVEGFERGNPLIQRLATPPKPDLILLDVMMPEMDGFEVCRSIRKMEGFKEVPILFLTAKNQDRDYLHGLSAGGTAYLEKPFDVETLPSQIRRFLR